MIIANKLIIIGGMNNNNYLGSSLLIVNLDFSFSTQTKSAEEIMLTYLKTEGDETAATRNRIEKLKSVLNKNQLGLVTNIELPQMK